VRFSPFPDGDLAENRSGSVKSGPRATWMCGAGPGDLRGVRGVGFGRNFLENRPGNFQPDCFQVPRLTRGSRGTLSDWNSEANRWLKPGTWGRDTVGPGEIAQRFCFNFSRRLPEGGSAKGAPSDNRRFSRATRAPTIRASLWGFLMLLCTFKHQWCILR